MGEQERDHQYNDRDGDKRRTAPEPSPDRDRRWGKITGISLITAIAIGVLGTQVLTPNCEGEGCPDVESLRNYRPPEPPRIYDARGNLAGQLSGPQRMVVELEEIPEIVREGYIAVEDRRFRDHGGVDLIGGARAFVANVSSGRIAEGASTITMQLARNVFGADVLGWNRFHRKLAEFRLARTIEDQLTKDEILELYLNQIYLGDGVYGVETASQHYFGKAVGEVSTREAALLIGLAKNPEGYNPRRNPVDAKGRIEEVLTVLVREGLITAEEAEQAKGERIELTDASAMPEWDKNAYYLSAVRRELRELIPNPQQREGLKIYTGLDRRAQAAGVDALVQQIRSIESGRWGAFRHEVGGDTLPRSEASPYLQGMVIAMDPVSGLVTTLVGGRDYHHSEFDRAFQALRQPGSAFKPIVYAAALGDGLRLSDAISTEPVRLERTGVADWEPGDHVSTAEMSVRDALVHSSNSATVRVGQRVGVGRVADLAHDLGISSEIPNYPSVFLGAADVVPAELVAAYAAFGNGGYTVQPHFITRIEDPDGRVVYERDATRGHRALDPAVAFLVLDMMRDVVRRGTGWRVGASGLNNAAGKTGTTNDSRDAWFIGMTPALVAGVWIGFDDPSTIVRDGSGGDLAAPVWASFMGVAGRDLRAAASWRPPPGVIEVAVDGSSRFGVAADCGVTGVRTEYFIQGTEPVEFCPSDLTYDPYAYGADSTGYRYYYDSAGRVNPYWTDLDTVAARLRRERQYTLDSIDAAERARMDSLGVMRPGTIRPAAPPATPGGGSVNPSPVTPNPIPVPVPPSPSQPAVPPSPSPGVPTQPPPPTTPVPSTPTQPVTPAPSAPSSPPPPPVPPDTTRTSLAGRRLVAPGPVGTPPPGR